MSFGTDALALAAAGLVLTILGPAANELLLLLVVPTGPVRGLGHRIQQALHESRVRIPVQGPLRAHRADRLPGHIRRLQTSPPHSGVRPS
jgi:hypothetical protein